MPRPTPRSPPALPKPNSAFPGRRRAQAYGAAAKLKGIEIVGVDVHIGSQITELAPFEAAFARVMELVGVLRADGHAISRVDLGGGLGVPYRNNNDPPPDPAAYGAMVAKITKGIGARLIFEPGRLIAANAGVLVSKVIYVKRGEAKHFLIMDAGMNDLIRPALYDAHHEIVPIAETPPGAPHEVYDVVGPVCETSDLFASARALPRLKSGDLVANPDGGRLWRGDVFGLQCPSARARSAREGRQVEYCAAATEL